MTSGYGFSTSSAMKWAEHLARVSGFQLSDDPLRRRLHKEGFSIHQPKHTFKDKRDEQAYPQAKKGLVRLKKKPTKDMKKYLRTNEEYLRINTDGWFAVFDRSFCQEPEALNFVKNIDTLMQQGDSLKKGDTSSVSRSMWNNRNIVIKRYNHRGFCHSLRHTIKRSRALKCWINGYRLLNIGVPTPKPLAYLEERKGVLVWESYLVTEFVDGQKLDDFLQDKSIDRTHRLPVIQEVLKLLDKLWKHHITHGDLKHTNLLVTKNGPVLTDLDGMMIHRWKWHYNNKQAKDVERFLREKDNLPITHDDDLHLGQKTIHQTLSSDFDKIRVDDWAIRLHKDIPKSSIRNLLSVSDSSANDQSQFVRVRSSRYARVFECNPATNSIPYVLYVKQYLNRSRQEILKHLLRPSRAKRAFNASLMLHANGFDTPTVIGLFERRLGPLCTGNLLLTKKVEGAQSIPELFADMCQDSDPSILTAKRDLIRAFAKTIGQMHARGIFHGDLRLGNVLVRKEEQRWRFFLIDNERTKKFHHLPSRLRLKNLVQVNMFRQGISNTDRMRFFKAYLVENRRLWDQKSIWARKINTKTNHRLRKKGWLENS